MAGANTDHQGNTFVKLGWNPIYLEPATPFRSKMPTWGVEIVCEGGSCNGLPCGIDPSKNKVNEMMGGQGDGAGKCSRLPKEPDGELIYRRRRKLLCGDCSQGCHGQFRSLRGRQQSCYRWGKPCPKSRCSAFKQFFAKHSLAT